MMVKGYLFFLLGTMYGLSKQNLSSQKHTPYLHWKVVVALKQVACLWKGVELTRLKQVECLWKGVEPTGGHWSEVFVEGTIP